MILNLNTLVATKVKIKQSKANMSRGNKILKKGPKSEVPK